MKADSSRIGAGVGLRLPHIAEMEATRPNVGWLEIHPENFLANPHAAELLVELSRHYPTSIHTVGISVGSAGGIDRKHLKRIRELVDRIDPIFVSGHLAWSTYRTEYLNDLLPLPYDKETLEIVQRHLLEVQEGLGRPYLIENPATYVGFNTSTMSEPEFLSELVQRTGCRLLCDVSNIHVTANNMGFDARDYLDQLPGDAIDEYHLGGFTAEEDQASPGNELLIDTHAAPIADPSWDLYHYTIHKFGSKPTLVEWDNELPPLSTLLEQAGRANQMLEDAASSKGSYAAR